MAWEPFYVTGDGLFPRVSMMVRDRDDWEKLVRLYGGDEEKLRQMQPEANRRYDFGGPGIIGDDYFTSLPTLGEFLDSMTDD